MNQHVVFYFIFVIISGFKLTVGVTSTENPIKSFKNVLNQQRIQTILQSIENRLQNLDQVYASRYAQHADVNSDQCLRKIEILDTKLSRIESMIDVQLKKLSENISNKNFKDDFTKDQIFRKVDLIYEKINNKISYIEGKLDMDVLRLQSKIESGLSKIDRLDHSISVRQADMESEISEGMQMVENVKDNINSLEQKLFNVTKYSLENFQNTNERLINRKFEVVAESLFKIENKLMNNSVQCQKDFLNDVSNKESSASIQDYGTKINNMYDELWKKSTVIENTVKNSIHLINQTRKEIHDNVRSLKKSGNKISTSDNQNDVDSVIDSLTTIFQKKFSDLNRKIDDNFESILLTQNLFLESCHRIQMDETQLEMKISFVLEKLLESFNNRSLMTLKKLQNVEEILKLYDIQIHRNFNQNMNSVIKLSEKTSEDRKKIEKILSIIKKEIENIVIAFDDEINLDKNDKFEAIQNLILQLQTQVNDLDEKMNKDNINYIVKQVLEDVIHQTKDVYVKQVNTTVLHNTKTIAKVDDSLKDIHERLNFIDTKINKYSDDMELLLHSTNALNHSTNINLHNERETPETKDIITLNILSDKNVNLIDSKVNLSRFNYSIIENSNESFHENSGKINDVKINGFSITDVPKTSTTPSIFLNNSITNNTTNTEKLLQNDNIVIINNGTDVHNQEDSVVKNYSTEEKITNIDDIPQILTENPSENLSSENSDTDKIERSELKSRKIDVIRDIFDKFSGIFAISSEEDVEHNTSEITVPVYDENLFNKIITTTDLADVTDYDDELDD